MGGKSRTGVKVTPNRTPVGLSNNRAAEVEDRPSPNVRAAELEDTEDQKEVPPEEKKENQPAKGFESLVGAPSTEKVATAPAGVREVKSGDSAKARILEQANVEPTEGIFIPDIDMSFDQAEIQIAKLRREAGLPSRRIPANRKEDMAGMFKGQPMTELMYNLINSGKAEYSDEPELADANTWALDSGSRFRALQAGRELGLMPHESIAIGDYTQTYHTVVNGKMSELYSHFVKYLKTGAPAEKEQIKSLLANNRLTFRRAQAMLEGLAHLPSETRVLSRGCKMRPSTRKRMVEGHPYVDARFSSNTALDNRSSDWWSHADQLVLYTDKGKNIEPISLNQGEYEYITPFGLSWKNDINIPDMAVSANENKNVFASRQINSDGSMVGEKSDHSVPETIDNEPDAEYLDNLPSYLAKSPEAIRKQFIEDNPSVSKFSASTQDIDNITDRPYTDGEMQKLPPALFSPSGLHLNDYKMMAYHTKDGKTIVTSKKFAATDQLVAAKIYQALGVATPEPFIWERKTTDDETVAGLAIKFNEPVEDLVEVHSKGATEEQAKEILNGAMADYLVGTNQFSVNVGFDVISDPKTNIVAGKDGKLQRLIPSSDLLLSFPEEEDSPQHYLKDGLFGMGNIMRKLGQTNKLGQVSYHGMSRMLIDQIDKIEVLAKESHNFDDFFYEPTVKLDHESVTEKQAGVQERFRRLLNFREELRDLEKGEK